MSEIDEPAEATKPKWYSWQNIRPFVRHWRLVGLAAALAVGFAIQGVKAVIDFLS